MTRKRVLVPFDLSVPSMAGARIALDLARKSGAEVVFGHAFANGMLEEARQRFLHSMAEHVGEQDVPVRFVWGQGDPGHVIADLARHEEADFLVLGVRRTASRLFGSNAARIVHAAEIPAIIAHVGAELPDKVIVETDPGGAGDAAWVAAALARMLGCPMETIEAGRDPATELLAKAGVSARALVCVGIPHHGALRRRSLGGVAETIVREAPGLVLLVPPRVPASRERAAVTDDASVT